MSKKVVHTDRAPAAIGPYSQGVIANGFLFTAGQIALDPASGQVVTGGVAGAFTQIAVGVANSTTYTDALRRAAEAGAISNWFVAYYLPTNAGRLYTLSGDLNEDINRPGSNYVSGQPIQKLVSPPTGLRLTTPVNPVTGSDLTESIRLPLDVRFDYILPCALLFSNFTSSQIFRTDLLANPPSPLQSNDDSTASDHLPVLMNFKNPYDTPFRFTSIGWTNQHLTLHWESISGRQYRVEASSNLTTWTPLTTLLTATNNTSSLTTNGTETQRFFRIYRAP